MNISHVKSVTISKLQLLEFNKKKSQRPINLCKHVLLFSLLNKMLLYEKIEHTRRSQEVNEQVVPVYCTKHKVSMEEEPASKKQKL